MNVYKSGIVETLYIGVIDWKQMTAPIRFMLKNAKNIATYVNHVRTKHTVPILT